MAQVLLDSRFASDAWASGRLGNGAAEPQVRDTNFGRIFRAKSPREMQLGLRLSF